MTPRDHGFLAIIWIVWLAGWCVWAMGTKPDSRKESRISEAGHKVPLAFALLMLWPWRLPGGVLGRQVVMSLGWVGVVLTALGMLFMVWARIVIGANWSGRVTIKQGHDLIDRGPYALVRHPIYTGLLAAYLFTGLTWGDWRGLVAPVIALVALWRKLRLEEAFLRAQFGPAYETYRGRTRALIPYVL